MSLLTIIALGAFRALSVFSGKQSENLGKRLVLQMEARRALLSLYDDLQQGIEIVIPKPGSTLPYVVFRDFVNDIRVIFQEKDAELSKTEGQDLFRVMEVRCSPEGTRPSVTRLLMKYVTRLQFTAYDPGSLLLTCSMAGGKGTFSLVNFVRLRNTDSPDFEK